MEKITAKETRKEEVKAESTTEIVFVSQYHPIYKRNMVMPLRVGSDRVLQFKDMRDRAGYYHNVSTNRKIKKELALEKKLVREQRK